MSITTVRNATYSLLTSCGPWLIKEVSSCDYGILAGATGCALIFHPDGDSTVEQLTFAGNNQAGDQLNTWNFRGNLFIKFTGNAPCMLSRVYQGIDDVQQTFAKSEKGQGTTASILRLTGFNYNIDQGFDLDGIEWGLLTFSFQEQEIDRGG